MWTVHIAQYIHMCTHIKAYINYIHMSMCAHTHTDGQVHTDTGVHTAAPK